MRETIRKVAVELDDFARKNDPYEYNDQVEDREEHIRKLEEELLNAKFSDFFSFFREIIEETDDKEIKAEAEMILEKLYSFAGMLFASDYLEKD